MQRLGRVDRLRRRDRLGPGRRGFLYTGFVAAPLLVLVLAAGEDWSTTRGLVGAVVALTVIPWLLLALAAWSFGGRDDGLVAFICGIAAVIMALMLPFLGGFVVAPVLALIPLAASVRDAGGWHRGRLVVASVIFVVSTAWYVLIIANNTDFSDVL
jgi:hypothetical protein